MPGHNGGFNPYRDQNGEFSTPSGAGKPGRSRSGGKARSARPSTAGLGRNGVTFKGNPTASNFNIARSQGQYVSSSAAYRQKGRGITGQETNFNRATRGRP